MAIFNSYVKLPDGKSKLLLKLTFARFCLETGLVCCSVATTRCRQDQMQFLRNIPVALSVSENFALYRSVSEIF